MALITIDLDEIRGFGLADGLVLCAMVALLAGLVVLARGLGAPYTAQAPLDLAPSALLGYSLLSLSRGVAATLLSVGLALWWGSWAARSRRAERVLLPLVDIVQSVPVLAFMPGLVLAMGALFPGRRLGLELAAVSVLVTSQVGSLVLAFYRGCSTVPRDLGAAADAVGLKGWRRLMAAELPAGAGSLVSHGMLAMAGGWFFLVAVESFRLGNRDFRLPGIGSYMELAVDRGDLKAVAWALVAMVLIVVSVDQLLWRPLMALAWRFRLRGDDAPEPGPSWVLAFLERSVRARRLAESLGRQSWGLLRRGAASVRPPRRLSAAFGRSRDGGRLEMAALGLGALALSWVGWRLLSLLLGVGPAEWAGLLRQGGLTLARVAAATALATAAALPLGVAFGMDPRGSRGSLHLVQVAASFPATMLFPGVVYLLLLFGVGLDGGAVALMALALFWPILLGVIDGAARIPQEQRLAWAAYGVRGRGRWRSFLLPALLPSLLAGWETAVVLGWNASIVAECVPMRGQLLAADGLGAAIVQATASGDFPRLTAGVLVLVATVALTNRLVWRRLFDVARRLGGKA